MSLDVHKIVVKVYVEDPSGLSHDEFVPVFHSWIQNHAVPDHTLIDVADYAHTHNGPGTLLVALEANFYLDRLDGQLGLSYSRKQPVDGSFIDRLRQACVACLDGCARLEDDAKFAGRIKFRTDELSLRLNDRLLAPNTPQTFQAVRSDLRKLAGEMYPGAGIDLEHYQSDKTLFEVRIRADQSPDLATLLNRLGATAPSR
jgi:hypothetical protein